MMKRAILGVAGAAVFATMASAAPPSAAGIGQEARIPFANSRGVRDFQADGTTGIYIQDTFGKWYRGTFLGACTDLPWVEAIGVDTGGTPDLDKFGTILVRHQRCALNSLVRVAAPPKKGKHRRA